jgi:DNA-binding NarL/FixJ family response regulator
LRIVLLDLDDQFRFWARTLLYRQGAGDVLSTADPYEALQGLEKKAAQIALIDINLQNPSTAEVVQGLRSRKLSPLARMPVLLLAKAGDKELIATAGKGGIEGVIDKPISEGAFLMRVTRTLLKPERMVFADPPAGDERRQATRNADDRITQGVPPSAAETTARSGASATPPREHATAGPRVVAIKMGSWRALDAGESSPPPAPPKPASRDLGDDPVKAAPKPAVRDLGDVTKPTAKPDAAPTKPAAKPAAAKPPAPPVAKPAAAAKPAPPAKVEVKAPPPPAPDAQPQKQNVDSWREALTDEKKDALQEKAGRDIDIPKILEDHLTWLESGGQTGNRARLESLDLSGADLSNVNLSNANLRGIDLSDSNCAGARFTAAEMRRAKLSSARLAGADLSYAVLRHADFSVADLTQSLMVGSDLAGAKFAKAKLKAADLTNASLLGSDLSNADLKETTGLVQRQIVKAYGDATTKLPAGLALAKPEEWADQN